MFEVFKNLKVSDKIEVIFNKNHSFVNLVSIEEDSFNVFSYEDKNYAENEDIELNIYNENGIFNAKTSVKKILKVANGYIYEFYIPKEVKHSQRREFLRVDMPTEFFARIFLKTAKMIELREKAKNICAKGICFISDKPISKDYENISLELYFEEKTIKTKAELVYSNPIKFENRLKFINAFTFTDINDENIKFIFERCMDFCNKKEEEKNENTRIPSKNAF